MRVIYGTVLTAAMRTDESTLVLYLLRKCGHMRVIYGTVLTAAIRAHESAVALCLLRQFGHMRVIYGTVLTAAIRAHKSALALYLLRQCGHMRVLWHCTYCSNAVVNVKKVFRVEREALQADAMSMQIYVNTARGPPTSYRAVRTSAPQETA